MVKSRGFRYHFTQTNGTNEMPAENSSADDIHGPSTSMVEVTPKTQQTTAGTKEEPPEINQDKTFKLYIRHSGMKPVEGNMWKKRPMKSYTLIDIQNKAKKSAISHLSVEGNHFPPEIQLLAPNLTHLRIKGKVVNEADAFAGLSMLEKLAELDFSGSQFTSSEALQALSSLQSITELNLSDCGLKDLPDSLSHLERLEILVLSGNEFTSSEAVNCVTSLQSLRELNLRSCGLENLPDSLSHLERLEILHLSWNKFTSSEALNCVTSLLSLRELHLFECGLENLPDSLSHLERLEILDLSFNKFTSSDTLNCVTSLLSLKQLNLFDCGLENLPASLSRLEGLQKLDLTINKFTSFETLNCVISLQSLRELDLAYCELEIPLDSVSGLEGLEKLDLTSNKFTSCKNLKCITSLQSLKELDLEDCELENLPDILSKYVGLQKLNLSDNRFLVDTSLAVLQPLHQSLRELNLSWCSLDDLPDSLSHLDQLRVLDLGNNFFHSLPPPVSKLGSLEELNLSNNEFLVSIDPEIQHMTNLKVINLTYCRNLDEPSHVIRKKGPEAIRKYFREKAEKKAEQQDAADDPLTSSTLSHQILSLEPSEATLNKHPGEQELQSPVTVKSTFGAASASVSLSLENPFSTSEVTQIADHVQEEQISVSLPSAFHTPFAAATLSRNVISGNLAATAITDLLENIPAMPSPPLAHSFLDYSLFAEGNPDRSGRVTEELQSGGWRSSPLPQREPLALDRHTASVSDQEFLGLNEQVAAPSYPEMATRPKHGNRPPTPLFFGHQWYPWMPATQPNQLPQPTLRPSGSDSEQFYPAAAASYQPSGDSSSAPGDASSQGLHHFQMSAPEPPPSPPLHSLSAEQLEDAHVFEHREEARPSTSSQYRASIDTQQLPADTYTGIIRGQTLKLTVNAEGETVIFRFVGKETVARFNTQVGDQTGKECTIRDAEGSLYGGENDLSMVQTPFVVRIGDLVNTVSGPMESQKRKHSESSDEEEPEKEYHVKRKEKKPLFGIVSSVQDAVKLLSYIHKQVTERSLTIHKVLHLPEVKKDRKTVDRFRNLYYLHEVNSEKLDQLEKEWKAKKKFGGLAALDETAKLHLDIEKVKEMAEEGKLTIFGEKALTN